MNTGRFFSALLISVFSATAFAHPGPHSHTRIDPDTSHAWLGGEAALILAVVAVALVLWRRGRRS